MFDRVSKQTTGNIGLGIFLGAIFVLGVLSSKGLGSVLETQTAVARASLVVNSLLTILIVMVYIGIWNSEEDRSNQISEQIDIMQDQLSAAHNPQLAVDGFEFSEDGVDLTLSNVGHGAANQIELEADIDVADSGLEILANSTGLLGNIATSAGYIGADETEKKLQFEIQTAIDEGGDEPTRYAPLNEALQILLVEMEYTAVFIDFTVRYHTVFDEKKQVHLGEIALMHPPTNDSPISIDEEDLRK